MRNALIVQGGWPGHEPKECADLWESLLAEEGFRVTVSDTLDSFADAEMMAGLSVVIPVWTTGEMSPEQTRGLLDAVASGVGIAGWHGGMGDSFRKNAEYQWMVGGQFVAHPGGICEYEVNITDHEDPITSGLSDFRVTSEQYYMHVDTSNKVLATTTCHCPDAPWVEGAVIPAVWKRMWDRGRVFYSSLGHVVADFDVPEVREIQRRGILWAAR